MSNSILELAYQLTQAGEPFVLATVTWCEAPPIQEALADIAKRTNDPQIKGVVERGSSFVRLALNLLNLEFPMPWLIQHWNCTLQAEH